jgi:hypothetical protein
MAPIARIALAALVWIAPASIVLAQVSPMLSHKADDPAEMAAC